MTRKSCAVGMRNAIPRNTSELILCFNLYCLADSTAKLCFRPDETGSGSDCCRVRLCSIEFDYVRLLNCSITERSIAFDWQDFFVSSIKFDYRTQSSDWILLASITERSISYAGNTLQV